MLYPVDIGYFIYNKWFLCDNSVNYNSIKRGVVVANNRFLLELLPDAVQLGIEQYLSPSDKVNVATACKATLQNSKRLDQNGYFDKTLGIDFSRIQPHSFFNSRMHARQKNLYQAGLYILTGKMNEALAMIDKDPEWSKYNE